MEKRITFDHTGAGMAVMGAFNGHARLVDELFKVETDTTIDGLVVRGENEADIDSAIQLYAKMEVLHQAGHPLTEQLVRYLIDAVRSGDQVVVFKEFSPDIICVNAKGRPILSKTFGQKKYVESIEKNELTFAIGPAGTGKTYLAVAMAVKAFREHNVSRIILTRPAVEAGEKLGFLPGALQDKVDPYMRPLYDALNDLMGTDSYLKNMDKGLIEVSPLAYMRGRTLDDAFIILDEAQNTTREQMKMFLTRIGFHAKAVVTGDITQIDLPPDRRSGLEEAAKLLSKVEGIGTIRLTQRDIVRNPLVQRIIQAYEADHIKKQNRKRGM
jgi:phosphate starvation-inducible PhoH-like protein